MDNFDIKNKSILVTGSTSGIGLEMSKKFNKLGVFLNLVGRNDNKLEDLKTQLQNISSTDSNFKLIKGDLNLDLDFIASESENLDGVVFNAGIVDYKPLKFINEKEFIDLFYINYFSSIFLLKKLIKQRKINKGGSIVFISSLSASLGVPGTLAYSASKASINSSVRVLASELSKQNIRVNSISPGLIKTPLLNNEIFNNKKYDQEKVKYPLGFGYTNDVINSTQFLLSEASRWITGTELELNGGYKLS